VAVERNGPVRAVPVASDKIAELFPQVKRFVDKDSYLITDENRAYRFIGKQFAAHDWVNHSHKEYVRGDIHNNTAESFSAILERAKQGVWISPKKVDRVKRKVSVFVFHIQPDKDNQVLSAFSADYRRPQYTQRWNASYPDAPHIVDDKPARFS